jgi:acetolactate synthase-1/2/3 large subunit
MNGAQLFWKCLLAQKVETIFGYPGGAVLPLYDELTKFKKLRHILVRHEQAASLAADGFSRAGNKVGVCVATSGPGATNLITGIANAHLDSVPIVAITGQVVSNLIGTDAFQEVDITGICQPICKQVFQIRAVEEIPRIVAEAFEIAKTGRPGPVLIDFPKDFQAAEISDEIEILPKVEIPGFKPNLIGNAAQISKAEKLIAAAERPVILAGHGIILSGAENEFLKFVEKLQTPVLTTLLAIGLLPKNHELNFGMLGMHGQLAANFAVHNSDLVVGIGLRFDDRILGDPKNFAPDAKVIHIDIDRAEIGKNRKCDVPIVGDAKLILQDFLKNFDAKNHEKWLDRVREWENKKSEKLAAARKNFTKISAVDAIQKISEISNGGAVVAADVGQNQMFVAQNYDFKNARNHLSSGGLGDMGFAIPAALGAKMARPADLVLAICGDGGFQMNSQELMTLVADKIAVKIVVLNNGFLGMVRQWQELFYRKNYSATPMVSPDFVKFAESFSMPAFRAETLTEVENYFKKCLAIDGPTLLEIRTEKEENVFPMVSPGASLSKTKLSAEE